MRFEFYAADVFCLYTRLGEKFSVVDPSPSLPRSSRWANRMLSSDPESKGGARVRSLQVTQKLQQVREGGLHLCLDLSPPWLLRDPLFPNPGQWATRLDPSAYVPAPRFRPCPSTPHWLISVLDSKNPAPIPPATRPVAPSDPRPSFPGVQARVSDVWRPPSDAQVPPRPQAPPRLWLFPASGVLS